MKKSKLRRLLLIFITFIKRIESVLTEDTLNVHPLSNTSKSHLEGSLTGFWEEILGEIESFLKVKRRCPARKYTCYPDGVFKENVPNKELCSCDSRCVFYGECCHDFISRRPQDSNYMLQGFVCSPLDFWANDTSEGLLMIGQCPLSHRGSLVESSCLLQVPKISYTYVLDIPVTSAITNLTYRNYYCALCNDDADHLVNINVSINCEKLQKQANFSLEEFKKALKYVPDTRKLINKSANCIFRVKEYQDIKSYAEKYNGRVCKFPEAGCRLSGEDNSNKCIKQVRSCDPNWPVNSDFAKCKAYSLKIFEKQSMILYKNPHCAHCNFVKLAETRFGCRIPMKLIVTPQPSLDTYPPSFSILFKPNTKPKKCRRMNQVWNPLLQECAKIICEENFYVKGGKCVRDHYTQSNNVSGDNAVSCPKIALNSSRILWLANGSIMTLYDNKTYSPEDFQEYNDSIVLVCASNSLVYYDTFKKSHSYVTLGVLVVSIVCLGFHNILYLFLPSKKTWHERNLFCMCCALFMAQLLFLTATTATKYFGFCVFLACLLHYFWLASFFWMSVLSFDIWRTFKSHLSHFIFNKRKVFRMYNLYAWGVPSLIVALGLSLDLSQALPKYSPHYAIFRKKELCWINKRKGLLFFFILPVGVIIVENVIFFILTSYGIYKQTKEARFAKQKSQSVRSNRGSDPNTIHSSTPKSNKNTSMKKNKIRFALYLKLSILQGLTWVTGFTASFSNLPMSWYFFTIVNGLQGAAIFLSFDLKSVVSSTLWRRLTGKAPTSSDKSTYASKLTNSPNIKSHNSMTCTPNLSRSTFAHNAQGRTTIQLTPISYKPTASLSAGLNKIKTEDKNSASWNETNVDLPSIAVKSADESTEFPIENDQEQDASSRDSKSLYVNEGFVTSEESPQQTFDGKAVCMEARMGSQREAMKLSSIKNT